MLVKLTAEMVQALGAENPADCLVKLSAVMQENSNLKKSMSEQTITLEAISKRLDAFEAKIPTDAKLSELVAAQVKTGISEAETRITASAEATASKIAATALGSVGTTPVKPSPTAAAPEIKTFAEIVQAGMASGKTKAASIMAAIEANPKEYQAYLTNGGGKL